MLVSGFEHIHVTERESAHQTPCGWDDGKWEDCLFSAALEWWRATGHPERPATHLEMETLRCASGRGMSGGTNLYDVKKAIADYYHGSTPAIIAGFDAIWSALTPGKVATVTGSMGAFSSGSKWRRWDPGFAGPHGALAYRVDATDRVWWCDPLAPVGSYAGEWMPKADFRRFIDALPGRALVGKVIPSPQEDIVDFKVPSSARLALIAQGAWIYDNPDCTPSAGNLQITPGPRKMPVAGVLTNGNLVIGYVDTTPTETALKVYYAKAGTPTETALAPAPPPVQIPPTEASCAAFIATAKQEGFAEGKAAGLAEGIEQGTQAEYDRQAAGATVAVRLVPRGG
jgi:hypothetical protein